MQMMLNGFALRLASRPGTGAKLTQQTCYFISFLLLDGLVVQSFKEDVQNQNVVSEEEKQQPPIR